MRTSAELFASLEPGQQIDLGGEDITSTDVDEVPEGVTISDGNFSGCMQLYDARRVTFLSCSFTSDPAETLQGQCRFLGGHGWQLIDCGFTGGKVASQLGVGLNSRARGADAVPTGWLVQGCSFDPLADQWGQYPQGHNIYVLTDPKVDMGGQIEQCILIGSKFGAAMKLGGTGNDPYREGCKGVTVQGCDITGVLDGAGRCLAVLTQGRRTEVALKGCTLRGIDARPWVQAMDGATVHLDSCQLPDGWVNHSTWKVLFWERETKEAHAGSPGHGVFWS